MLGLVFIAGAITKVDGQEVFSQLFENFKFTKQVLLYMVICLGLMLAEALIESISIVSLL